MSGVGKMNSPFGVEKRSTGLLNEDTSSISEFDYPFLFPNEKVKSMLFFKLGDLFAERRLADSQYLSCPRKVQP